jgi:hypothetical protein
VGTSSNAVKTQIWTALIAMLLLRYLQRVSTIGGSLAKLVALLRMNLFTHRVTEFFQENVRDDGMPYSPVDSHWSPEGHDLVANRLVAELRQRGWLSRTPTAH